MRTVKLPKIIIAGLILAAIIIALLERHTVVSGFSWLLGQMIEVQRSFNRNLAHHLREANDNNDSASLWAALGLAFTYGVVHAAGPGHGKFVVTTYFLSHQRRIWRGFMMGTQIAVMHVISAIIIVLIAHYLAQRFWDASGDMPGLRVASYACIAAVGFFMLWRAWRERLSGASGHTHDAHCHHHHGEGTNQGLLSLAVGVAPCSGAVLLLIFAFANDLVGIGILMTVAIAVGMALTMIGLGLFTIMARHFVTRHLITEGGRASKIGAIVETAGAILIILFGLSMALASLYA
jgi:ABC-type nickel/cobalt efflux system permease component RcnA